MTINGTNKALSEQIALSELLCQEGFQAGKVAVELNGAVAPKPASGTTRSAEPDQREGVSLVGGGRCHGARGGWAKLWKGKSAGNR